MNAHAAAIRRYFDAASDQYARGRAQEYSFTAQKRIALEFLPARSARVLDIGCGPAVLADELLERADEYSGIDLSPQMIAHGAARMKGHPQGSRCTLSVGDAEALAFPDASFDAVVALGLLEYLPSYERALREMCRVLRPGGTGTRAFRGTWTRSCGAWASSAWRAATAISFSIPCMSCMLAPRSR